MCSEINTYSFLSWKELQTLVQWGAAFTGGFTDVLQLLNDRHRDFCKNIKRHCGFKNVDLLVSDAVDDWRPYFPPGRLLSPWTGDSTPPSPVSDDRTQLAAKQKRNKTTEKHEGGYRGAERVWLQERVRVSQLPSCHFLRLKVKREVKVNLVFTVEIFRHET